MSNVAGEFARLSRQINVFVPEPAVAAVVHQAARERFAVSAGVSGEDFMQDVERLRPEAFVAGPGLIDDSARISSLTGGSVVFLRDLEPQWPAADSEESERSDTLLAIALVLAALSPPAEHGAGVD
jgi:hypothetical protein